MLIGIGNLENQCLTVSKVTTDAELEIVSDIRYRSYLKDGLIDKNATEKFVDRYDNTLGAQTYAVSLNGTIVSSIRMHTLSKKHAVSATYTAFEDHLKPLIQNGGIIVDGARFVVDPDLSSHRMKVARVTLDVASGVTRQENAGFAVAAVQEAHARYYQKAGGFKQVSEPRLYGGLKKPFVLVMATFEAEIGEWWTDE